MPRRSGISLLEILISIGVLSIGLLGVASLIPIGKLALIETNKSDRSGACGRAALREIKARRMLKFQQDPLNRGSVPKVYIIDPLGATKDIGNTNVGGLRDVGLSPAAPSMPTFFPLPRFTLLNNTAALSELVFRWHDDLLYVLPKDYKGPATNGNRPMPAPNPTQAPESDPSFSWFFTVTPVTSQPQMYWVSVAVCYKRDFSLDSSSQPAGEQAVDVSFDGSIGYGGGTLTLTSTDPDLKHPVNRIKDNQWVMLCGWRAAGGNGRDLECCQWYKVVGVNRDKTTLDSPVTKVTVVGSDWNTSTISHISMVVVDGVIGVYSAMIRLDEDAIWSN